MSERWKLVLLVGAFLVAFFLPIESPRVQGALLEGWWLLKDYARQHVLLCLVPAFFIAGAIGQFVSQGAVMKYLGSTEAEDRSILIDHGLLNTKARLSI